MQLIREFSLIIPPPSLEECGVCVTLPGNTAKGRGEAPTEERRREHGVSELPLQSHRLFSGEHRRAGQHSEPETHWLYARSFRRATQASTWRYWHSALFFFSKGQKNKGKAAANSVEALTAKEQITSLMEEALPLRLK